MDMMYYLIVVLRFAFSLVVALIIFSCVYWLFMYLSWRNASQVFCVFKLDYLWGFFCCYWISGVTYTVCLSYQFYDLQIFSPILCIPSLFYQYYLLMHTFKIFMKSILSIFSFVFYAFGHIQKINVKSNVVKVLSCVFL